MTQTALGKTIDLKAFLSRRAAQLDVSMRREIEISKSGPRPDDRETAEIEGGILCDMCELTKAVIAKIPGPVKIGPELQAAYDRALRLEAEEGVPDMYSRQDRDGRFADCVKRLTTILGV